MQALARSTWWPVEIKRLFADSPRTDECRNDSLAAAETTSGLRESSLPSTWQVTGPVGPSNHTFVGARLRPLAETKVLDKHVSIVPPSVSRRWTTCCCPQSLRDVETRSPDEEHDSVSMYTVCQSAGCQHVLRRTRSLDASLNPTYSSRNQQTVRTWRGLDRCYMHALYRCLHGLPARERSARTTPWFLGQQSAINNSMFRHCTLLNELIDSATRWCVCVRVCVPHRAIYSRVGKTLVIGVGLLRK